MAIDRRTFLARGGNLTLLALGAAIGMETLSPRERAAAAELVRATPPLPSGTPILVMIDLQGGNDATNMLINPNDPWYYDTNQGHGSVAIAPANLLSLAGTSYALHPSMPWTAARFANQGDVAFIRGPGENVVHEFSHFAAMHYRQVATFNSSVATGWLGRLNDRVALNNPFASISTQGVHPALVGNSTSVLSVPNVQYFNFDVGWQWEDSWLTAWQAMAGPGWPLGTMSRRAETSLHGVFEAQSTVYAAWDASVDSTFASTDVAQQLDQVAMMIRANVPCRTYVVSFGGFDTHGSENSAELDLFGQLDTALSEFFASINGATRANDVFIYMSSEFGRQQTANDSGGCDHGQAGTDILIGPRVKGGLYGQTPDTAPSARLDDALVPTVDFRSVYATILEHMTNSASLSSDLLFGTFENLGCFAS